MKSTDDPIIVEQILDSSRQQIWKAISDPTEMRLWFFENIGSFSPEIGFRTQFVVLSGDRTFTHLWEIIDVVPHQRITFNWNYEEYSGDSEVSFEVLENADGLKLRLTHRVIDSFPDDIPEFSRESGLQGWRYFIQSSLKEHLRLNLK